MTPPSEPNEPTDEAMVDSWFARQRRDMDGDLATTLDLDMGLHEILLAGQHRDMGVDLAGVLNLHAGLAAILPHHKRNLSPPTQFDSFTDLLDWLSAVPMVRLTHRTQLLLLAGDIGILHLASTLDRDLTLARAFDDTRAVYGGRRHALDLALDLALALALGHDLTRVRALALALGHDLTRVRGRNFDLALDRDRDRALDLIRALDRACGRKRVRRRALDLIHNQAHDLVLTLCGMSIRPRVGDLVCAINGRTRSDTSWLDPAAIGSQDEGRLNELAADFTGVDLREAKLNGLDLVGVRWSRATRWPPADLDWILAASEPVGNGVYVITELSVNGGVTVVPDPASV